MKQFFRFFVLFALTGLAFPSWSKQFRNAYVSFEMRDNWKCSLEVTEWVCRSDAQNEAKEAVFILTAKEVGPVDSFDAYTQHLNTPQTAAGAPSSVVYQAKQVKINDQIWIDGLHSGSEVPNYFTRYMATIKDQIAILVTLSAHKDHYTKYSQDFFKTVQSLRVVATKNLLTTPDSGPIRPGSETLGSTVAGAFPADMTPEDSGAAGEDGAGGSGSSNTTNLLIGLAVILAAVTAYVVLKMSKK